MKKYILLFIALFALPFICSAQKMLEFSPIYDYGYYENYTAYEANEHENLYTVHFDLHKDMDVTLSNCGSSGMTAAAMSLASGSGSIALSPRPCGAGNGIQEATLFLPADSYTWQVAVTAQSPGWVLQLTLSGDNLQPEPSYEDPVDLGIFMFDRDEVLIDKNTSHYPPAEGSGGAALYYFETVCSTDITFHITDADKRVVVTAEDGSEVFRAEGQTALKRFPKGSYLLYADFISGKDGDLDMYFSVHLTDPFQNPTDTLLSFPLWAPSSLPLLGEGRNYVLTRTLLSADEKQYQDVAQYVDGLGRSSLLLEKNMTPSGKSLLSLQEYDEMGRLSRKWLPVDAAGYYMNPKEVESRAVKFYAGDSRPYTLNGYEDSPLDRVVSQHGSGMAWKDHPRQTVYALNGTSAELRCSDYYIDRSTAALKRRGDFAAGELSVTKSIDEDGHALLTFKDKEDRVVLSRRLLGTEKLDTYSVYDFYGNLTYVLPPMVKDNITASNLDLYAYRYKYDSWNRCIEKKLPGAGNLTRFVYDKADRLILQQDGKQTGRNEWTLMLHDGLGREVVRGLCTAAGRPSLDEVVVRAVPASEGGLSDTGYQVEGFAYTPSVILSVNYYDDYSFLDLVSHASLKSSLQYGFTDVSGASAYDKQYVKAGNPDISSHGLLTGSKVYPAGGGSGLLSSFYYDGLGNVVQSRSQNHLGGYEKDFYAYTFSGKPLKHLHVHTASGKSAQREVYTYIYDSKTGDSPERLLRVQHQLNAGATVTLAENAYNELGRLKNKKLHNGVSVTDYDYNIRNWLTGIRNNKFTQTLHYTDGSGTPYYNGNISSMTWKSGSEITLRGYKFTYDALNRLKDAAYGEGTNIASASAGNYSEKVTSYDWNGNILSLQRYGKLSSGSCGKIDDLTYGYTGNQLKYVNDAVTAALPAGTFHFADGSKSTGAEYTYDANGNLTKDSNKKISVIEYNFLNLPCKVTFADGSSVVYTYTAAGTKLKAVHKIGSTTTTTDYCGNVIYENGVQKSLLTEAGYVTLNDKKYHYYLQDHQGNNRVVINSSGTVEESNHYYPFGGTFASSGSVQPYKYNGKELDAKNGLNWYDYGARQYDAAVGRFTTVDPLAEKYITFTAYVYCANNPIKYIDPTGADMVIWYKDEDGKQRNFMFNGKNAENAPQNSFVNDVITAYNYNVENGGGENMQAAVTDKNIKVGVVETSYDNRFSKDSNLIRFNPRAGLKLDDGHILSPATGLEHETAHKMNDKNGVVKKSDKDFHTSEERSVIKGAELKTAKANGELPANHSGRKRHSEGKWVVTFSVTSNQEASSKSSEELRRNIDRFKRSYTSEP